MHVRLGAAVLDKNQVVVGHVDRLIIDPKARQIVQLVARQGHINAKDHIIDRSMASHVDADGRVHLNITAEEVEKLGEFYAVDFSPKGERREYDWMATLGAPLGEPLTTVTQSSTRYTTLPENVVVVAKGLDVRDRDFEKIGELEDIDFGDQATITGFTARGGRMFRHTTHTFRAGQVAGVGTDYVRLNLTAAEVEASQPGASGG